MFFDDVESLPYMRFQRKDNFHMEISTEKLGIYWSPFFTKTLKHLN